jgi:hypothetical protein
VSSSRVSLASKRIHDRRFGGQHLAGKSVVMVVHRALNKIDKVRRRFAPLA